MRAVYASSAAAAGASGSSLTYTNSGYENLVRAAEAMEQMNAFYREFFRYGVEGDTHTVPRIDLRRADATRRRPEA